MAIRQGKRKKLKKKNPFICIHKCCLQYFLEEIKHLMKKTLRLMCVEKRNKCVEEVSNSLRWVKKNFIKSL